MRSKSALPATALPFLLCFLLLAATSPLAAAKVEIKLATQAPESSPWHKMLVDMNEEWQEISQGDVSLVIYPGGVSGDESDILRKMRTRQLHAGALTVSALTDVHEWFSVFQIPLFFDSWEELNYVLDDLTPRLVERLEEKGFVWLTWGHVGWVHFFTKEPVERLDELRDLKVFTWAGNEGMVQWFKRNGFKPVALALPDALQGLKTGMIETMISPPLAALTLQWYKEAPFMIDVGLVPMVGAIVVTKRDWNRIDEAYRAPLLEASRRIGERLEKGIPFLEETAVNSMQHQGLEILEIRDSEHAAEWLAEAEKFADEMRGETVPAEIFDLALRRRNEFRRRQPQAPGNEP